jgi:hypothetical protein
VPNSTLVSRKAASLAVAVLGSLFSPMDGPVHR